MTSQAFFSKHRNTTLPVGALLDGNLTQTVTGKSVTLTPAISDLSWLQKKFQQNIQRAADTVIVQYGGKEYALVADYNFAFNDPHWGNADMLGKQIGGKIGIIQDPFGKNGEPVFLGATTPIVGGAVEHLSLTADGKLYADVLVDEQTAPGVWRVYKPLFVWDAPALIQAALDAKARGQTLTTPIDRIKGITGAAGQIATAIPQRYNGARAGEYFGWMYGIGIANNAAPGSITPGWNTAFPSQSHAWNVADLIHAAVAMPDKDRMSKHINVQAYPNIEQLVKNNVGLVAGTFFDDGPVVVNVNDGRMGDVVEVDLKKLSADVIARELLKLAKDLPETAMTDAQRNALIKKRDEVIQWSVQNFTLNADTIDDTDTAAFKLVRATGNTATSVIADPYTRLGADSELVIPAYTFKDTGRMYLAPNITATDETTLRNGGRITDKVTTLLFKFQAQNDIGLWEWRQGIVTVTAKDIPAVQTFFGDRPLDNPGYSAFTLHGEVSVAAQQNKTIDVLDVYRVEQRLKYLGFPAFGAAPTNSNDPVEFKVDGTFGDNERRALKLFEKVIRYNYSGNAARFNEVAGVIPPGADGTLLDPNATVSEGKKTLGWLNAWNTPHWMNVGTYSESRNAHIINSQDNSDNSRRENYGTSWIGDWLVAQQYAPLAGQSYIPYQLLFNGAVDGNLATTPTQHKSHGLGMAFDIGIKSRPVYGDWKEAPIAEAVTQRNIASDQMSQLSSPTGFITGQWNDAAAAWFVQPDTRTQYAVPSNVAGQTVNVTVRNNTIPDPDGNYRLPTGASWGAVGATTGLSNNQRAVAAEILSLYSITDTASAGFAAARSMLSGTIPEQTAKATSLFGIWNTVFIGDPTTPNTNAYSNIRTVLTRLGVNNSAQPPHYHHFHLALKAPAPKDIIDTHNLLTQQEGSNPMLIDSGQLAADTAAMLALADTQTPPAVVVSEPNWSTGKSKNRTFDDYLLHQDRIRTQNIYDYKGDGTLGIPSLVINFPTEYRTLPGSASHEPQGAGIDIDTKVGKRHIVPNLIGLATQACLFLDLELTQKLGAWGPECKITQFLQMPTQGDLVKQTASGANDGNYYYTPRKPNTQDVVRFILENGEGKKVDVTINLNTGGDDSYYGVMSDGINQTVGTNGNPVFFNILANVGLSFAGFADLPAGALGQTTGSSITLDTTASGNGWYIDTTPSDNSEYLPTSNPNEWVAKAGSAAAGKMDMLTVLLHEYGHALGIDHNPDAHDYMGTTLTAGVRRLPTPDELALMGQLVAQAKALLPSPSGRGIEGEGATVAADTSLTLTLSQGARGLGQAPSPLMGEGGGRGWIDTLTTNGSNDAPNPFPTLPFGGMSLAFAGLLQRNRYGSLNAVLNNSTITQYAVAANSTLVNGNLVGRVTPADATQQTAGATRPTLDGWSTQGSVTFNPSSFDTSGRTIAGSATLNETATTQTRLNQVFMVNANDRYLSFTLSGTALDDLNGLPDDAFEVALLNANTGVSLLSSNGLTHSDAFLNLQADGTEHLASGVTRINNADGSRTYRVDLSGVASGTAVNLSFDLIGFGQNNSHVNISDVRLSGLPQLHDDAVTLLEDGTSAKSLVIARLSQCNRYGGLNVML